MTLLYAQSKTKLLINLFDFCAYVSDDQGKILEEENKELNCILQVSL